MKKLKRKKINGKTMEDNTLPKLLVSREEADEKIQDRIEIGEQLRDRPIDAEHELDRVKADFRKWSNYNSTLLSKLFNNPSIAEEYAPLPYMSAGSPNASLNHKIDSYQRKICQAISSLRGICDQLELYDEPSNTPQSNIGDKIFIVHGHHEAAKQKIARFIENQDLAAIILDEQPIGHTIIDKFEEYADETGFAIVLLTGDDIGAPKDQEEKLQPRARQNVILEFGYFLAELGRKRIGVLYEEGVELPSDIEGLEYIPLDNADGWKIKLAKGMRTAGFEVDLNKI